MATQTTTDPAATTRLSDAPSSWRLFLVSTAALYLEIVLIRWLGTEVKIFAFFQNLSLIVCFLGFGIGCFTARKRASLMPSVLATTLLVAIVNLPFDKWRLALRALSSILSFTSDAALWGQQMHLSSHVYYPVFALALFIVTAFLMLLAVSMIPLGRWVGYYLESSTDTVSAYSINLLGSLVGIWLLAGLAFLWLSPSWWFAVTFALILLSQPVSLRTFLITAVSLLVVIVALRPQTTDAVYWSPYQKLSVKTLGNQNYQVNVNNEGYMSIANVTPAYLQAHPTFAANYQQSSYDSPFQFAQSLNRVLVVGAGGGNDVAAALRHGAAHVDAVEIDPLIASLGKRLHPERPYDSPRVRLINNDARNYMRSCTEKYDVVLFGLLDSHTEFSGYSNVRVDNYVYTEQSFREAQRLLAPGGILVLKFEVRAPWTWMGQRFYSMLGGIFGQAPVAYYVPITGDLLNASVFIESNSPQLWQTAAQPAQAAFIAAHPPIFDVHPAAPPAPTTDDWPYVYHFHHSIPRTYFSVSAVIVLLALYMVGPFFEPRRSSTWIFFLLGGGFLLMETHLVSRLALYFGTTWIVNCIALSGILTVLLLANFCVNWLKPAKLSPYYLALCIMLVIDYSVPWNSLPGSGVFVGTVLCIACCIPIFFAGIIFTSSFQKSAGSSSAFGANMLGAVAGGLAQNLSFLFGMKALLLIAAVFYVGSALVNFTRPLPQVAE
ncbi:MAG: methyltransferase domain-containing protein [Acidobacteriota bacterium]|nr:methyltransferase domain-containing protein [Acidobacteriota bacterium]